MALNRLFAFTALLALVALGSVASALNVVDLTPNDEIHTSTVRDPLLRLHFIAFKF